MTLLRQRMIHDMKLRRFAEGTQKTYVYAVTRLARYYKQSPDLIEEDQVLEYLLHLHNACKLAWSTCDQHAAALEFFFRVTLKRSLATFRLPSRRHEQRLPEILSASELEALFAAPTNPKHRAMLMTAYAGGLRLSEVLHLKVADIDSQRMMIRIEQGKRNKDRYTLLSQRLLEELRAYWKHRRPSHVLFPGRFPNQPLHRYTHRIAIANHRIVAIKDGNVTFSYRDRTDDNQKKVMTLTADEFIRRFLLHTVPLSFQRIRHFGFLANRRKTNDLARCRELLGCSMGPVQKSEEKITAEMVHQLTGVNLSQCPACHTGRLHRVAEILRQPRLDSS